MEFFENILTQGTVQRLGWVLIHFIWQAATVAFVLAILLKLLRKYSANLRYIVACLGLVTVVLLPVVTMSLIPAAESYSPVETAIAPAPAPAAVISTPIETEHSVDTEMTAVTKMPAIEPELAIENIAASDGAPLRQSITEALEPNLPYVVMAWLVGVFGLSIWYLGGWTQLQRLRRKMVKPVDECLQRKLKELQAILGVSKAIEIVESTLVHCPTVIGWLKPVILLPASVLTGFSGDQIEAILAHELAHIKRCDYLVNMLQTGVEILGFYHPAVWWISKKIRAERENCCDDIAVKVSGDKIGYAKTLALFEGIKSGKPELAVAASGGSLFQRICRLIQKDPASVKADWKPSVITIVLIIALLIPIVFALTVGSEDKPADTLNSVPGEKDAVPVPELTAHKYYKAGEPIQIEMRQKAYDWKPSLDEIYSDDDNRVFFVLIDGKEHGSGRETGPFGSGTHWLTATGIMKFPPGKYRFAYGWKNIDVVNPDEPEKVMHFDRLLTNEVEFEVVDEFPDGYFKEVYEDGWEDILGKKVIPHFTDDWRKVGVAGSLLTLRLNTVPFNVAFDIFAQAEGSDKEIAVGDIAVKANSTPYLTGATPKKDLTWDNVGQQQWRLILKPSLKVATTHPGIERYYGRQHVTEWLTFKKSERFEANKKSGTRKSRQGYGGTIKADKPTDLDILARKVKGDNRQTWPLPDGFDLGWSEENGGTLRINPDSNVRMLWLPEANASRIDASAETVARLGELPDSTTTEITPPAGKRTLVAVSSSTGKYYFVTVKKVNSKWANLSWYEAKATTGKPKGSDSWKEEFYKVYSLEDDRVLKHMAPPYIPERKDYYYTEEPSQAKAIPSGPGRFIFHWDEGLMKRKSMGFGQVSRFRSVLHSVFGLKSYEYEMPEDLINLKLPGDWIIRNGASVQAMLDALETIINEELKRNIKFQKRTVQREVIVVTGRHGVNNNADVHIYADERNKNESNVRRYKSIHDLIGEVGHVVGIPVIDKTEDRRRTRVHIKLHHSAYLIRIKDESEKARKLNILLDNLSKQTNLKFEVQTQPVEIWFIIEDGGKPKGSDSLNSGSEEKAAVTFSENEFRLEADVVRTKVDGSGSRLDQVLMLTAFGNKKISLICGDDLLTVGANPDPKSPGIYGTARVVLSARLDKNRNPQFTWRSRIVTVNGRGGGPVSGSVPAGKKLKDLVSLNVKSGVYHLGTNVKLGTVEGRALFLRVDKWVKPKASDTTNSRSGEKPDALDEGVYASLSVNQDHIYKNFPDSSGHAIYILHSLSNSNFDYRYMKDYERAKKPLNVIFGQDGKLFTEKLYEQSKQDFEKLARNKQAYPASLYAQRWVIILDWLAEKQNTLSTVRALNDLAAEQSDKNHANMTVAYASVVLARDGYIEKAVQTFVKCSPELTGQWGWFAFEINKYFNEYVKQTAPNVTRRQGNTMIQEARTKEQWQQLEKQFRKIMTAYADYIEYQFLPLAARYITSEAAREYLPIERIQIMDSLRTLQAGHFRSFALGATTKQISERARTSIRPKILAVWQKSLALLDGDEFKIYRDGSIDFSVEIRTRCKRFGIPFESLDEYWKEVSNTDEPKGSDRLNSGSGKKAVVNFDIRMFGIRFDEGDDVYDLAGKKTQETPGIATWNLSKWRADQHRCDFIFEVPVTADHRSFLVWPSVKPSGTQRVLSGTNTYDFFDYKGKKFFWMGSTFPNSYKKTSFAGLYTRKRSVDEVDLTLRYLHGPIGETKFLFKGPFIPGKSISLNGKEGYRLELKDNRKYGKGVLAQFELFSKLKVRPVEPLIAFDKQGKRHLVEIRGSSIGSNGSHMRCEADIALEEISSIAYEVPKEKVFKDINLAAKGRSAATGAQYLDKMAKRLKLGKLSEKELAEYKFKDAVEAVEVIDIVRGVHLLRAAEGIMHGINTQEDGKLKSQQVDKYGRLVFAKLKSQQALKLRRTALRWTQALDPRIRMFGVQIGLRGKWPEFAEPAISLLGVQNLEVRRDAANSLQRYAAILTAENLAAIGQVIQKETNVSVQMPLMNAIKKCKSLPVTTEILWQLANDSRPWLWMRAIGELGFRREFDKRKDLPAELKVRIIITLGDSWMSVVSKKGTGEAELIMAKVRKTLPELLTQDFRQKNNSSFGDVFRRMIEMLDQDQALEVMVNYVREIDDLGTGKYVVERVAKRINTWHGTNIGKLGTNLGAIGTPAIDKVNWQSVIKEIVSWYESKYGKLEDNPKLSDSLNSGWGKAVDGLQTGLTYDLQNRPYFQGERVSFKVNLRNNSNKAVDADCSGDPVWHPRITDANGKPVKVSSPVISMPRKIRYLSLGPGETKTIETVFLKLDEKPDAEWDRKTLNPYCYLKPGEYYIECDYHFNRSTKANWHGKLTTGKFKIEVLPKKDKLKASDSLNSGSGKKADSLDENQSMDRTYYFKLPLAQPRFHWKFADKDLYLSGKLILRTIRNGQVNEIVVFDNGEITKGWEVVGSARGIQGNEIYFGFYSTTKYPIMPSDKVELELIAKDDLDGIGSLQTGILKVGTHKAKGKFRPYQSDQVQVFIEWQDKWPLDITSEKGWLNSKMALVINDNGTMRPLTRSEKKRFYAAAHVRNFYGHSDLSLVEKITGKKVDSNQFRNIRMRNNYGETRIDITEYTDQNRKRIKSKTTQLGKRDSGGDYINRIEHSDKKVFVEDGEVSIVDDTLKLGRIESAVASKARVLCYLYDNDDQAGQYKTATTFSDEADVDQFQIINVKDNSIENAFELSKADWRLCRKIQWYNKGGKTLSKSIEYADFNRPVEFKTLANPGDSGYLLPYKTVRRYFDSNGNEEKAETLEIFDASMASSLRKHDYDTIREYYGKDFDIEIADDYKIIDKRKKDIETGDSPLFLKDEPKGSDTLNSRSDGKIFVTGVNPDTLIQTIAGKDMSIAQMDAIRGHWNNLIIAPNNLIRDAIMWDERIVGRNTGVRTGLRFVLVKNNAAVGQLLIGVFADNKSAVEKFEELFNYSSVGPDKNLRKELGNRAFGWGTQRIDFVRDNVAVSFHLFKDRLIPAGLSPDVAMTMAKKIDEALVNGSGGVSRASVFPMPRILEVDVPEKIFAGSENEAKVHIALPMSVNGDSEVEIIRSLKHHAPTIKSENRKDVTYEITYITPNCVVTSKQVVMTIINKENEPKASGATNSIARVWELKELALKQRRLGEKDKATATWMEEARVLKALGDFYKQSVAFNDALADSDNLSLKDFEKLVVEIETELGQLRKNGHVPSARVVGGYADTYSAIAFRYLIRGKKLKLTDELDVEITKEILSLFEKSAKQYEIALEVGIPREPQKLYCMYHLAEAYLSAEKIDLAVAQFRKLVDADQTMYSKLRLEKNIIDAQWKPSHPEFPKQVELILAKYKDDGNYASIAQQLALVYMEYGQRKKAIPVLETLIKIDGNNPMHMRMLEKLKSEQKASGTLKSLYREIFLPEILLFDLASGQLASIEKVMEEMGYDVNSKGDFDKAITKYGKGDFFYDYKGPTGYLFCVRDSSPQGKSQTNKYKIQNFNFQIKDLPLSTVITTREGQAYEITILTADINGCEIKYRPIPKSSGTLNSRSEEKKTGIEAEEKKKTAADLRLEGWKVFLGDKHPEWVKGRLTDKNVMNPDNLITVKCVDEQNRPIPYCRIVFVDRDEKETRRFIGYVPTNHSGYAYCDAINGSFSISAQVFDYSPLAKAWRFQHRKIDKLHKAKDKPVITIKWPSFPEGNSRVLGAVKDQYGRPLKEFSLMLYQLQGQRKGWGECLEKQIKKYFVSPEGNFEIGNIAAGTYKYYVHPTKDYANYTWNFDMGEVTVAAEKTTQLNIEIKAKSPPDKDMRDLLIKRRDILRDALLRVVSKYSNGRASGGQVDRARIELLRIESELAETPQKRIEILEQIVSLLGKLEKATKKFFEVGRASSDELKKIKLQRLDAVVALLKAKGKAKKPGTLNSRSEEYPEVKVEDNEAWGKSVNGVQVRLRSDKLKWRVGEDPVFKADIRNSGKRNMRVWPNQEMCRLVLDGEWYDWMLGGKDYFSKEFAPGTQFDDIKISLPGTWHTGQWQHLLVTPGKHTVRVAFRIEPKKSGKGTTIVSNPIEIEILPGDKTNARRYFDSFDLKKIIDETAFPWGSAIEGASIRVVEAKQIPDRPEWSHPLMQLKLEAKNYGGRYLHLPHNSLNWQIQVDGLWYEWVARKKDKTSWDTKSPVLSKGGRLLDFNPGDLFGKLIFENIGQWRRIPKGKEVEYAEKQWGSGWVVVNEDHGDELVLASGKHSVRVAIACPPSRAGKRSVLRLVSNLVEVDIKQQESIEDKRQPLEKPKASGSLNSRSGEKSAVADKDIAVKLVGSKPLGLFYSSNTLSIEVVNNSSETIEFNDKPYDQKGSGQGRGYLEIRDAYGKPVNYKWVTGKPTKWKLKPGKRYKIHSFANGKPLRKSGSGTYSGRVTLIAEGLKTGKTYEVESNWHQFVVTPAGYPIGSVPEKAYDQLRQANAYRSMVEYDHDTRKKAIALYEAIIKKYPGSKYELESHYGIAEGIMKNRDLDQITASDKAKARRHYENIINKWPDVATTSTIYARNRVVEKGLSFEQSRINNYNWLRSLTKEQKINTVKNYHPLSFELSEKDVQRLLKALEGRIDVHIKMLRDQIKNELKVSDTLKSRSGEKGNVPVIANNLKRAALLKEANAVMMMKFQQALKASQWNEALSLCSDAVRSEAEKYESSELFLKDVLPINEILALSKFYISGTGSRWNEVIRHHCEINLKAPDYKWSLNWILSAVRKDSNWVIEFPTKPLNIWLKHKVLMSKAINNRITFDREKIRKGFDIRLVPLSEYFVIGQPMLFRIEIENISDETLGPIDTRYAMNMVNDPMLVKDPKNTVIPFIDSSSQTIMGGEFFEPGEVIVLTKNYDVTSQYHITEPGKYTFQLKVFREINRSNIVGIDIKPGQLSTLESVVEKLTPILPKDWTLTRGRMRDIAGFDSETNKGISVSMVGKWGRKGTPGGRVSVFMLIDPSQSYLEKTESQAQLWGKSQWGDVYVRSINAEQLWPDYKKEIINALDIKKNAEQVERKNKSLLLIDNKRG